MAGSGQRNEGRPEDLDQLLDELIARLREEGAPEGTWLLDIERSRAALREADEVLRRLKESIIRSASRGQLQ